VPEQHEAGAVAGIILDVLDQDGGAVERRRAASGHRCPRRVGGAHQLAHAPGRVLGRDPPQAGMSGKEPLALRQRHRMRSHGGDGLERSSRDSDEALRHGKYGFCGHRQPACRHESGDPRHQSCDAVLHRNEKVLSCAVPDGLK
jgi:hypothetical protein